MEVITHKTKTQNADIKTQHADCNVIHSKNEILSCFENVILFQSMAADMIIPFHLFYHEVMTTRSKHHQIIKKIHEIFLFLVN